MTAASKNMLTGRRGTGRRADGSESAGGRERMVVGGEIARISGKLDAGVSGDGGGGWQVDDDGTIAATK